MHKILCTGNPNKQGTLANIVKEVFPSTDFVHLSAGYDFTTSEGLEKFRNKIKDYNVFINATHSQIRGLQIKLLKIAREEWSDGHVFNIGSVLENDFFSWFSPEDAEEKRQLRTLSLDLCSERFKTTHLVVGGFKDQKPDAPFKMDPIHIIKGIEWVLAADGFHVPIIGIENDYWNKGQPGSSGNWDDLKTRGLNEVCRKL
jgi:hypothetical protein